MNSHTSQFAYAILLTLGFGASGAQAFVANPISTVQTGLSSVTPVAMCGRSCRNGGRYIQGPPSVFGAFCAILGLKTGVLRSQCYAAISALTALTTFSGESRTCASSGGANGTGMRGAARRFAAFRFAGPT